MYCAYRAGRRRGLTDRRSRRRGDETLATPRDVDHIAHAVLAVAKGSVQCRDMAAQVAVVNGDVWPNAVNQFALTNHVSCMFEQDDQDVQGAAAKRYRVSGPFDHPFCGGQPEWTERDDVLHNVIWRSCHLSNAHGKCTRRPLDGQRTTRDLILPVRAHRSLRLTLFRS
jgi:hypothetical protein